MTRLLSMLLAVIMILSISYSDVLANGDVPSDLPVGTIKVAEGIYAYTSPTMPQNNSGVLYIGTVPAYGSIIQPNVFNNIRVDAGHNFLCLEATKGMRINFVRGTQSVFGPNLFDWPIIGSINTTYYIEADYYNIARNVAYQLQCTSDTSNPRYDVEAKIWSDY